MMLPIVYSLVVLVLAPGLESCGPGGLTFHRRRQLRPKLTPMVLKEAYPSTSENALSASGPSTGALSPDSPKFKDLVLNYNPDVIFADEEGDGSDHLMSRNCKERVNTLAISVLNRYPGVKLKVLEAYDMDLIHDANSLHYEGRAIDIALSDRDRGKLGILARLAVESGFNYVKYSSKYYVHASVKLESTDVRRAGGCFAAHSLVETPAGTRRMDELSVGDEVLVSTDDGVAYSPVLLFLDRDDTKRVHINIRTESGVTISLTASHLLFVVKKNATDSVAEDVEAGKDDTTDSVAKDVEDEHAPSANNVEAVHFMSRTDSVAQNIEARHFMSRNDATDSVTKNVETGHFMSTTDSVTKNVEAERFTSTTDSVAVFAKNVEVGHYLYVVTDDPTRSVVLERVVEVSRTVEKEHYAPLTAAGTIFVNNVLASCYAMIEDHDFTHRAFAALRLMLNSKEAARHFLKTFNIFKFGDTPAKTHTKENFFGMHYYAETLLKLSYLLLPESYLYQ